MRKALHIDIETYSDIDLKRCGVYRYAESPAFSIDLFCYAFGDEPVTRIDLAQGDKLPARVLRAIRNNRVVKYAHNAQFERVCIGTYLDGKPLDPTNWRCTMVWGSCLGLPQDLKSMALALGSSEQKDAAGKRLINYFAKPCKPTNANGGRTRNLPEHAPDDWELYGLYCEQDVDTERGIHHILESIYTPPAAEWQTYETDQRINDAGVPVDGAFVNKAIKIKNKLKDRSSRKLQRLTGIEAVTKIAQFKTWAAEQGFPVKSLDKDHCADYLEDPELAEQFPEVYRMIELYQEAGGAAVAKYDTIMAQQCLDGTIKGQLRFCGAGATARWAGKGVQVQNLPRVYLKKNDLDAARQIVSRGTKRGLKKFGNPIDVLTQLIRTSLHPPAGHKFAVSDYSAIEARVTAWFAGEAWVLQAFRDKRDIYVATAMKMYHLDEEGGLRERQKGKQATLALGFGGGTGALIAMGALRAGIAERELPDLVKSWRRANPKIVNFWKTTEKAARHVIQAQGKKSVRIMGGKLTLKYQPEHRVLQIFLPSGRALNYFDCGIRNNRVSYLKGVKGDGTKFHTDTFGGKLVENVVQATARDLLAEALKRIEAAGLQTAFHVHDETINIVPEGYEVEALNDLMVNPIPAWAEGLPMASEGEVIDYYRKV